MSYEPNPAQRDADASAFDGKSDGGKFATLTASLLARKGEAEPALEPFAHARVAAAARQMGPGETHALDRAARVAPALEDEAEDSIEPAAPPAVPALEEDAPRVNPAPRSQSPQPAPTTAKKEFAENCPREKIAANPKRAAVTFRMSVHDFLRLKLASAELEISSQEIIIEAVEAFLDAAGVERLDDCKCLKATADACGARAAAE